MISPDLDANQKRILVDVLQEYLEAFKDKKNETPQITVNHRINTGDTLPVRQRAYRVSQQSALRLQEYDLEIVYKRGKKHKDADSLSRNNAEDEVFPYAQKTNLASFSDIAEKKRKDP
ncbi:hypothetical protein TNIN_433111 [Trichonephila inaurata madagascariensis]|uniref:Uncharacterized protein n=1 Tax=Trichonephila inaurata madagascariensis TaxID=2747483 RepID=A0A8X6YJ58_9ARAC|nr:hypothetical protein TNIN_433111 [Trichonephila inaurata madagascariensis]